MSERTIRYKVKVSKDGKKATLTIESSEEIDVEDFKLVVEQLMSKGGEGSADTH